MINRSLLLSSLKISLAVAEDALPERERELRALLWANNRVSCIDEIGDPQQKKMALDVKAQVDALEDLVHELKVMINIFRAFKYL